jgi:hypothetical protein
MFGAQLGAQGLTEYRRVSTNSPGTGKSMTRNTFETAAFAVVFAIGAVISPQGAGASKRGPNQEYRGMTAALNLKSWNEQHGVICRVLIKTDVRPKRAVLYCGKDLGHLHPIWLAP